MRILIDMNLSPDWADFFQQNGLDAVHWSSIGDPRASDSIIFQYAKENDFTVFTHDLDFGAILAATNGDAPSVIQVRTQDILPSALGIRLLAAIQQSEHLLQQGALLTLDESNERIRILPLH